MRVYVTALKENGGDEGDTQLKSVQFEYMPSDRELAFFQNENKADYVEVVFCKSFPKS